MAVLELASIALAQILSPSALLIYRLALLDAAHPHSLDQIVDRTGQDDLDIGRLDEGRQRPLGKPARFEEAGK